MRERTTLLILALVCALCAQAKPARAQQAPAPSFQVEHFEPLPSQGINVLNASTSELLPHLFFAGGVLAHWVDTPLRLVNAQDPDDVPGELIRSQLKTEVWGSLGLFGVGELGVVLPMIATQSGDAITPSAEAGQAISGAALADVRLVPRVRLPVAPERLAGFGAGLLMPVYLPTGDPASFSSDGQVRVEPRLVVDWRHPVGVVATANLGYQLRPRRQLENITSDDALRWALALELPTAFDAVRLVGSLFGTTPLMASADQINRADPAEILGGAQIELPWDLFVSAGAGTGIGDGVGAPQLRVFASLGYTPRASDQDADGILDSRDACPARPEDMDNFEDRDGCPDPDNDRDGLLDDEDACPNEPEDFDGYQDEDGCPDPDNDGDGIPDAEDKCPDEPGVPEKQGCPIRDRDADGIEDEPDECPDEPEDLDGFEDEDGCPDDDHDGDGIPNEDRRVPRRGRDLQRQ